MTKKSDEDSIHPSETAYDKAIKRMEEREACIEHMRFTVENETGKTVHEYLLPNYVASCCKEIGIDGIRYRSTGYNCCVLWKDDYFEYAEGSREVIPE